MAYLVAPIARATDASATPVCHVCVLFASGQVHPEDVAKGVVAEASEENLAGRDTHLSVVVVLFSHTAPQVVGLDRLPIKQRVELIIIILTSGFRGGGGRPPPLRDSTPCRPKGSPFVLFWALFQFHPFQIQF